MKLKEQVISLKLAKKLYRLGVKQYPCLFVWTWHKNKYHPKEKEWFLLCTESYDYDAYPGPGEETVAAFTEAELGEMIWNNMSSAGKKVNKESFKAKTEANRRAKMLIYLIENKLIDKS